MPRPESWSATAAAIAPSSTPATSLPPGLRPRYEKLGIPDDCRLVDLVVDAHRFLHRGASLQDEAQRVAPERAAGELLASGAHEHGSVRMVECLDQLGGHLQHLVDRRAAVVAAAAAEVAAGAASIALRIDPVAELHGKPGVLIGRGRVRPLAVL